MSGLFIEITISFLLSILGSLLLLLIANIIYKIKLSIKKDIVFILMFSLIIAIFEYGINSLSTLSLNIKMFKPILLLLIRIISIKYLLGIYFKQSTIICFISTLIMSIAEIIVYFFIKLFIADPKTLFINNIYYFLSNLAMYFVGFTILLSIKSFNMISDLPRNIKPRAFNHIYGTFLVSFTIMFTFAFENIYLENNVIMFIIFTLAVKANFVLNLYSIQKIAKIEINEQELELQKFYNKSMSEIIDKLRMYKHDIGNMINTINGYVKLQKYDKLSEYLNEHISDMNNTNSLMAISNIKNAALYGIISSKIERAQVLDLHMQVVISGELNEVNNIKISHLCEILGIFLDNAIEASYLSTKKFVSLNIINKNNSIIIRIENSHNIENINTDKLGELGFSTKGSDHGTGLYIVKKLLSNNNKVINNTSISNEFFIQELLIKNP